MDETITNKKLRRFEFLNLLYDKTGGSDLQRVNTDDLSSELNLTEIEAHEIARYLHNEGLIKLSNLVVSITHQGVLEVEQARSKPDTPTEHFPALNIINIGQMTNSQISQSSTQTNQVMKLSQEQKQNLEEFLNLFEQRASEIPFHSEDDKKEVNAEIATIKAQLESPKPKWEIIKQAGGTVKGILEKAAGSILADQLLALLKNSL